MIYTITLNPCVDKTVTVEKLKPGGLNRTTSSRTDPAGKAINVSIILAQLEVPSVPMGFLAGNAGKFIYDNMVARGLEPDFIWNDGETRTNLKVIDGDGTLTEINEPGPPVTLHQLETLMGKVEKVVKPGDWIVASGSLPPGAPPETYAKLAEIAKRIGAKCLIDADGIPLRIAVADCEGKPYMLKPNLYELQGLIDSPINSVGESLEYARVLTASGIGLVVVSLGEEGAIFATSDEAYHAISKPIDVKSTVGCGDTLAAATIAGLCQGYSIEEVARSAVSAATAKAAKSGTQLPTREEMESYKGHIRVERM